MNGLKTLLAVAINGVALPGLIMVAGGIVGGYYGAFLARKIDGGVVRAIVIVIAWTMTAYFFVR